MNSSARNKKDEALHSPAASAVAVTPHDTNALATPSRGLWIGGAGAVTVRLIGDTADVVFSGIAAGTMLPVRATHVRSTGTTATLIVAVS